LAEELTLASMRRLIKKHGDLRVSEEAGEELRYIVGEYGSKLGQLAVANALSERRKTVLARDVRAAQSEMEGLGAVS